MTTSASVRAEPLWKYGGRDEKYYIIIHMKQILIQVDDETAARLERIAPGRSRKRSEFLRGVIARALQDAEERRTRQAYARWPDAVRPVDPAEWADEQEALRPPRGAAKHPRTRGKSRR